MLAIEAFFLSLGGIILLTLFHWIQIQRGVRVIELRGVRGYADEILHFLEVSRASVAERIRRIDATCKTYFNLVSSPVTRRLRRLSVARVVVGRGSLEVTGKPSSFLQKMNVYKQRIKKGEIHDGYRVE